jgi:hypothetical protein
MRDFSKPYRDVAFFGIWADDSADHAGRRDALAVVACAVERCQDEDVRQDEELAAALAFLSRYGGLEKRVRAFRQALAIQHPTERQQAAQRILAGISS